MGSGTLLTEASRLSRVLPWVTMVITSVTANEPSVVAVAVRGVHADGPVGAAFQG